VDDDHLAESMTIAEAQDVRGQSLDRPGGGLFSRRRWTVGEASNCTPRTEQCSETEVALNRPEVGLAPPDQVFVEDVGAAMRRPHGFEDGLAADFVTPDDESTGIDEGNGPECG